MHPGWLQESLMEFGTVFWVDLKVRFQSQISGELKKQALKYGLVTWTRDDKPTSALTHPTTLKYFNRTRTQLQSQPMTHPVPGLFANIEILHRVMGLWVSCVLEENCVDPVGARDSWCSSSARGSYFLVSCHRYSTSAFNVALEKIFSNYTVYIAQDAPFTRLPPGKHWLNDQVMVDIEKSDES